LAAATVLMMCIAMHVQNVGGPDQKHSEKQKKRKTKHTVKQGKIDPEPAELYDGLGFIMALLTINTLIFQIPEVSLSYTEM